MSKFIKPATKGQRFGASDSDHPTHHTETELSRLYDTLYMANLAGISPVDVFQLASDTMKMEFNYSKWQYVPA